MHPLVALIALAMNGQAAQPARPLIGVSANPPENGTLADSVNELIALRKRGLDLLYVSHKWGELEPQPGEINTKPIEEAVNGARTLGLRLTLTFQTLDTNNRTLPPDLMREPFNSPQMRARFLAFLDAVAPKLAPHVYSVQLANEADIYLGEHRSELEAFASLMEAGRDRLRLRLPNLPVGVTSTFEGLVARRWAFDRLNRETDIIAMTYYPLTPDFGVRATTDVGPDMGRMLEACGKRPLCLQEIGYPASPLLGSSEAKQAAFVDAVFASLARNRAQIGYCNFFLLHDFTQAQVKGFLKYYGVAAPRFEAYLATLGLKQAGGTPRTAWQRFLDGLSHSPAAAR